MNKSFYWAIIIIGFAAFLLSGVYYSPLIFGDIWQQYRNRPNPHIPKWTMIFAPLREIIAAYVISVLILRMNLQNWKKTASLMVLLWLAFHAVGMGGAILWDNMQWQLGIIHAGDWLMKMLFMGIALTVWFNKIKSKKKI